MWHFREIGDHGVAADVLPEGEAELRFSARKGVAADDLAEFHSAAVFVRHLDADGALVRDRRLDADIAGCQRERQIVGEVDDLRHAHARRWLELVLGDRRADVDVVDLALDAEIAEGFLEQAGVFFDLLLVGVDLLFSRLEKLLCRQHIFVALEGDALIGAILLAGGDVLFHLVDLVVLDDRGVHLLQTFDEILILFCGDRRSSFFVVDVEREGVLLLPAFIRQLRGFLQSRLALLLLCSDLDAGAVVVFLLGFREKFLRPAAKLAESGIETLQTAHDPAPECAAGADIKRDDDDRRKRDHRTNL